MSENPFLDPAFHVRWSELRPELIQPAIIEAIGRAESALQAIEALTGELTFENTFLALDESTETLNRTWGRVSHLQSVADTPQLREAHNQALPIVSAFSARIPLRPALWAKLKTYAASAGAQVLGSVRARFVSETVAEFRDAGADLSAELRARLETIQTELAQLTQKYSENVLDATNSWQLVVSDEGRLEGLPAHAKARALADAASKGASSETGCWLFTLHMPSQEPFMTYVADEALREEMWRAASSVGAAQMNLGITGRWDRLDPRPSLLEKARILGKDHFADLVLSRRMAKTGTRALAFIEDLERRCSVAFERECRELEEHRAAGHGGAPLPLAPWEVAFQSERLRRARYAFDEEALRPYFPMDRVVAGIFEISRRVFGIRVSEREAGQVETWHPQVRFYDVLDAWRPSRGLLFTPIGIFARRNGAVRG